MFKMRLICSLLNLMNSFCCVCRNLSYRITEADRRSIGSRRVTGKQRGGHQRPADHRRTEGQQTAVLSKPVTMTTSSTHLSLISDLLYMLCPCSQFYLCNIYIFLFDSLSAHMLLPWIKFYRIWLVYWLPEFL